MSRVLILGLFFLSGAVGLVYEIVWVRELTLLFGVSIYAVSAVLVAFMGGLGLGSEYFGKKLNSGTPPVRLYAILEISIGVYVLLFPFILGALETVYVHLHPGTGGNSFYVVALRFVLSVSALLVPTCLMGGTLPALGHFLSGGRQDAGKSVGALYAVNTIGAVIGCIVAGFWLIEHIGLTNSLRAGAVINMACGVAAYALVGERSRVVDASPEPKATKHAAEPPVAIYSSLLVFFGISGFCAMAFEVLWTRMLILLLNNTTYAFSLILAIFLLGIGAGSALTSGTAKKSPGDAALLFARFQVFIGLLALISLLVFAYNGPLMDLVAAVIGGGKVIPGERTMMEAGIFSAIIIFPCTFLMGGCFPLIVGAISSAPEKTGGAVGRLYAMNMIGCVLGSIVAGYLFIPLIGIRAGVIAASWLAVVAGISLQLKASQKREISSVAIPLVITLLLTAGVIFTGDTSYLLNVQKLDAGSNVEYYKEGPSATVLVSSQDSDLAANRQPIKRIWINGDPIAGAFREALQLERLQAHIPLMVHPSPKNALVICFGTGTTAGAALSHGLKNVTAVDISREVFGAAGSFSAANFDVVKNPAFTMVEEDGRNYLLTTQKKFDFITSEPPPPSNAGVVSLYTREYYRLCKKRLAEGGVVSQWIPLHHLSHEDFRALVATFTDVFPNAAMWYTKWDAIMVGSNSDMPLVFSRFESEMKKNAVAESLKGIGITNAHQLLSNFMMGPEQLRGFTAGALPVTDDRPYIEFTSPRIHAEGVTIKGRNLESILKFRAFPKITFETASQEKDFQGYFLSEEEYLKGQVQSSDRHYGEAANHFRRALGISAGNSDARYAYLSLNIATLYSALSKKQSDMGLRMLADTDSTDIDGLFATQSHFLKGMFFADKGRHYEAEREFIEALRLDPKYMMAAVNLAGLYGFVLKDGDKARELYNYALTLSPSESERQSIVDALGKLI